MRPAVAPLAAALLACAGSGPRPDPAATAAAAQGPSDRPTVLAMRLSEGMNCVAAAAIDWPLLNARGDEARRGWARAGVAALREVCSAERGSGGSGPPFGPSPCSRLGPQLDALERAASGPPEAIRAAARDVTEVFFGDLALPAGVKLDRFLQVSASLALLEQIASDEGWGELRNEPEPASRASIEAAAVAIQDTCSVPASAPPGWDCTRAQPHLDALKRLAAEPSLDERVRPPARALLGVLRTAPVN